MSRVRANILANYGGKIWTVLMSFLFVPFYLRLLGVESYGLIGFLAVLSGVLALFDFGLSATLNRELARLSIIKSESQRMSDLVRTLEVVFWLIAIIAAVIVVLLSSPIAHSWITTQTIPEETVVAAIRLMGVAVATQLPLSLYQGGLTGLQRQVLTNTQMAVASTVRHGGGLLVLWLVVPSLESYFVWQIVVSLAQVIVVRHMLWRSLPQASRPPEFRLSLFNTVWHYAAGMMGVALLSVVLSQMDRVMVSKALTLEYFGYYSLAIAISQIPLMLANPITNAVFPSLTQTVALGDSHRLTQIYHRTSQLVSVLVLPGGLFLSVFSREIILLWTGDSVVAEQSYLVAALRVVGTMALALQTVPYVLALAHGWTKPTVYLGIAEIVTVVPLLWVLVSNMGGVGAAGAWLILNVVSTPVYVHILHRRLLRHHERRWYVQDVLMPLLAASVPIAAGRLLMPSPLPMSVLLACLVCVAVLAFASSVLVASEVRLSAWSAMKRAHGVLCP